MDNAGTRSVSTSPDLTQERSCSCAEHISQDHSRAKPCSVTGRQLGAEPRVDSQDRCRPPASRRASAKEHLECLAADAGPLASLCSEYQAATAN